MRSQTDHHTQKQISDGLSSYFDKQKFWGIKSKLSGLEGFIRQDTTQNSKEVSGKVYQVKYQNL